MTLFVAASIAVVDVETQTGFIGQDFPSFYSACRGARLGIDIYDIGALGKVAQLDGLGQPAPYIYPPVFAYLLQPMARLKPAWAQRLWSLATAVAFCAAAVIATVAARRRSRASGAEPLPWPVAVTISVCLALALNYHNVVAMGQINLFVLALMSPALLWPDEDAGVGTAFGLALAILIKSAPLLFLVLLLVQGRRRLAGWTVAWIGVIVAVSLILGAGRAWVAYLRLLPLLAPGQEIPGLAGASAIWNFSLAGLFARITDDPSLARRLATRTAALLGVLLLVVAWRARSREGDRGLLLAASALMIASSPLAYVHHAIFLFPALFCWLSAAGSNARLSSAVALALGMIAATDLPGAYVRLDLTHGAWKWFSSINLYALLALFAIGLRQAIGAARRVGPPINA